MIPRRDITGIVLSGGRSSRMGQNKSLMMFHDKPLIMHAIDILRPLCTKVTISSNDEVYDFTGCEVWPDELPVQAAMIGFYSCLKRSRTEWNILLPCDMPLIDSRLFLFLADQSMGYEAAVPRHHKEYIEPLCSLFNRKVLDHLEHRIQMGLYSMHDFIRSANCRLVDISNIQDFYRDNMFMNVNSPEDLELLGKE